MSRITGGAGRMTRRMTRRAFVRRSAGISVCWFVRANVREHANTGHPRYRHRRRHRRHLGSVDATQDAGPRSEARGQRLRQLHLPLQTPGETAAVGRTCRCAARSRYRSGDKPGQQSGWVGDYRLDDYPGSVKDDGVQAIIDTILASTQPVTLLCIGPVPNIAEALAGASRP